MEAGSSSSQAMEAGSSSQDLRLQERSPGEFYNVRDEDGWLYEIVEFLGDIPPVSKVCKANCTKTNADGQSQQEIVALKFARDDGSNEFLNMRQEAESSYRIGASNIPMYDISADNIMLGIYKYFVYKGFFFISMPYMKEGSLRFIMNSRFSNRKMPDEKCIAVVLRETLKGLCFLHGRERLHGNLHAGNIYVSDLKGPAPIKLGFKGSTYFHCPRFDYSRNIWNEIFHREQGNLLFYASTTSENWFWTTNRPYEPSRDEPHQYHLKKYSLFAVDIWNFGVTALELALGPLVTYSGSMRIPHSLRTFLTDLQNNQGNRLPTLHELFIADLPPAAPPRNDQRASTSTAAVAAAADGSHRKTAGKMMMEGLRNAVNEVKKFGKKIKGKIFHRKPNPNPNPRENQLSSSFIAMVKRCLVLDPKERPTAQMLLNDPFFAQYRNVNLKHFLDVVRNQDRAHIRDS